MKQAIIFSRAIGKVLIPVSSLLTPQWTYVPRVDGKAFVFKDGLPYYRFFTVQKKKKDDVFVLP